MVRIGLKLATARVVIVDDEELFLNATSRILSRAGYEVLPASRPHQALEIIRNAPIDLVISDVVMPEMRGTELVRKIGRIRPGTARLLITGGLIDPAEVPEGVPLLRKPFSTAELISAASAALERSAQISTAKSA
jgi:DNA-binding NtrC family response regulator